MKTTIELPDDLYRRAKSEAALRGRRLRDLVEDGLRWAIAEPRQAARERTLAELMSDTKGVFASGIDDLGSDPRHLTGFGGDAKRNR